jgi:hypothetical protein
MWSLPIEESPLRRELFEEAAGLYRAARRAGLTIRSGVYCLIAACAIRNGLAVLHSDRDHDRLGRVSPLETRRLRAAPSRPARAADEMAVVARFVGSALRSADLASRASRRPGPRLPLASGPCGR